MTYILDASVFIQAKRIYYAFDIAPTFWEKLVEYAKQGRLISIDRVKNEIDRGEKQADELKKWANGEFKRFFCSTKDPRVLKSYGQLMHWAYSHPRYLKKARDEFADDKNADAWVVAYAMAHNNCAVVTQETAQPGGISKIKIPDACDHFGVQWVNTFEMMRQLQIKL